MEVLAKRIKNMAKKMERYGRYRTTMRELSSLTDRDLADIGINRGMIHQVALEEAVLKVK
jgi:uncharacterized protein YjiS (DUF1127 family)